MELSRDFVSLAGAGRGSGSRKREVLSLFVMLFLFAVVDSAAQTLWRGRAEVEVKVKAEKGAALSGAKVTFRYLEARPVDGPPSVVTNQEGKAKQIGLAEGRWHVEVVLEGYRSYLASVRIRLGKKVEILSSAVLSEDGSGGSMRVDFSKARKGKAAIPPAPAPPPAPVPIPVPAAEESPVESEQPTSVVQPAPEPTSPAIPEEPERPVLIPPPVAEIEEAPVPARVASTPPSAASSREEHAASMPVPAPAGVAVEEPQPAVKPPAPPLHKGPKKPLKARSGRGCPDCRAGEQAVTLEVAVAAGASSQACPEDLDSRVREVVGIAIAEGIESFLGPLLDAATRDLAGELEPAASARVRELLEGISGIGPSCRLLAVVLPRKFLYSGYRYGARDVSGDGDCPPSDACRIGKCSWQGNPRIVRRGGLQVIYGTFSNRSPDRIRHPALTVYFKR